MEIAQSVEAAQPRLSELDVLRGIAAFVVVLFHYTVRYGSIYGFPEPPAISVDLGYLGVEFFFCISGFVILMTLERTRRPLDFVVSRFARLWPAYIAAVTLTFLAVHIVGLRGRETTLVDALINLSMIHELLFVKDVDEVYWSLEVELIFYAWMFAAYSARLLPRIRLLILASLIPTVIYAVAEHLFGKQLSYLAGVLLITKHMPFFAIGIAAYNLKTKKPSQHYDIALMLLATIIAALCLSPVSGAIAGFSALVFLLVAKGWLKWLNNAPLRFLGTISYTLYLIHQNIGYIVIQHSLLFGASTNAAIVIAIAVSIALAAAITYSVEQPARKLIRRIYMR
jgi:peptidoglycan/LPS O-acetylase OafA/YrhL